MAGHGHDWVSLSAHVSLSEEVGDNELVVTKLDKGSGIVVMDKSEYLRLLSAASVDDTTNFARVDDKRPNLRGRPPKHYHPLLQKEKDALHSMLHRRLSQDIATSLSPKSSRLAHLYGLPKTHKAKLSMRPILSATGTYNFNLAKWIEEKIETTFCERVYYY